MKFHEPTLNFVGRRKKAFNLVFHHDTPEHNLVGNDLANYSGFFADPVDVENTNLMYMKLGRQQMFRRIYIEHLLMPVDELYKRYGGPRIPEER